MHVVFAQPENQIGTHARAERRGRQVQKQGEHRLRLCVHGQAACRSEGFLLNGGFDLLRQRSIAAGRLGFSWHGGGADHQPRGAAVMGGSNEVWGVPPIGEAGSLPFSASRSPKWTATVQRRRPPVASPVSWMKSTRPRSSRTLSKAGSPATTSRAAIWRWSLVASTIQESIGVPRANLSGLAIRLAFKVGGPHGWRCCR